MSRLSHSLHLYNEPIVTKGYAYGPHDELLQESAYDGHRGRIALSVACVWMGG